MVLCYFCIKCSISMVLFFPCQFSLTIKKLYSLPLHQSAPITKFIWKSSLESFNSSWSAFHFTKVSSLTDTNLNFVFCCWGFEFLCRNSLADSWQDFTSNFLCFCWCFTFPTHAASRSTRKSPLNKLKLT